ncbi:MAG: Rubrerythrin [Firmicutes bacterium]|nr:Rubrerythrin [Bacillota bacterium]
MSTSQNLADAFAGESQANRKYLAFAKQADLEGYHQVARLFRATAEAETIHAHAQLKAMGGIKSTINNLQEAISGETHEYTEMYPPFIQQAEAENKTEAARSFKLANAAEEIHATLYKKALNNIETKQLVDLYLCPVCGYIAEGHAPDNCPICNAKASSFVKID